jgi:hypothetical protein
VRWGLAALEAALFGTGDPRALALACLKLVALGALGVAGAALVFRRTARA